MAVGVLGADHDVGDRLAPGQLVGVVLERADEHDRPLVGGDVGGQRVRVLERRGDAQAEDADQLGDRAGAAGAGEDHRAVVVRADRLVHQPPGVLPQPGRLQPGAARLGVGVGVAGQHLAADEVLDEPDRAPGRRVVGVRHPARPERARHHVVVADHRLPDPAQQRSLDRAVPLAIVRGAMTAVVSPVSGAPAAVPPGVRECLDLYP